MTWHADFTNPDVERWWETPRIDPDFDWGYPASALRFDHQENPC